MGMPLQTPHLATLMQGAKSQQIARQRVQQVYQRNPAYWQKVGPEVQQRYPDLYNQVTQVGPQRTPPNPYLVRRTAAAAGTQAGLRGQQPVPTWGTPGQQSPHTQAPPGVQQGLTGHMKRADSLRQRFRASLQGGPQHVYGYAASRTPGGVNVDNPAWDTNPSISPNRRKFDVADQFAQHMGPQGISDYMRNRARGSGTVVGDLPKAHQGVISTVTGATPQTPVRRFAGGAESSMYNIPGRQDPVKVTQPIVARGADAPAPTRYMQRVEQMPKDMIGRTSPVASHGTAFGYSQQMASPGTNQINPATQAPMPGMSPMNTIQSYRTIENALNRGYVGLDMGRGRQDQFGRTAGGQNLVIDAGAMAPIQGNPVETMKNFHATTGVAPQRAAHESMISRLEAFARKQGRPFSPAAERMRATALRAGWDASPQDYQQASQDFNRAFRLHRQRANRAPSSASLFNPPTVPAAVAGRAAAPGFFARAGQALRGLVRRRA